MFQVPHLGCCWSTGLVRPPWLLQVGSRLSSKYVKILLLPPAFRIGETFIHFRVLLPSTLSPSHEESWQTEGYLTAKGKNTVFIQARNILQIYINIPVSQLRRIKFTLIYKDSPEKVLPLFLRKRKPWLTGDLGNPRRLLHGMNPWICVGIFLCGCKLVCA